MPLTLAHPKQRRWTLDEYYRLADYGFFQDQRVELIAGRIIQRAPQKDRHATAVLLARDMLADAFGPGYVIRPQLPLRVSCNSEPEPDLAVVAGATRDFVGKGHPTTALLIVEISETTLAYDRRKGGLYATAGVADYWIVNLINRRVEVRRQPVADASHAFGHRYTEIKIVMPGETIAPLAMPSASIAVNDLLP